MKRATRVLAALVLGACAQPGMPPGGPPDDAAPELVGFSPESGAVNVRDRGVVLRFDEVVSERSTPTGAGAAGGGGALGLAAIVQLSPSDGRDRVIWRRNAVEIEPRDGFRPNTAYRVTILAGLADLRGNRITGSREFSFSTGASVPAGEIHGAFFDWAEGRTAAGARVEAWRAADSTFRWITRSDSVGRFRIGTLEPGAYLVHGWIDADGDRRVGPRERFERIAVELADSAETDLYAFEHDTIGPRIEAVDLSDSLAIRIRFDRPVATDFVPDSGSVILLASDSTRIPVGVAVAAARVDTVARPAQGDSAAANPGVRAATDTTPRQPAAAATVAAREVIEPKRPTPPTQWVVSLATPLVPGTYMLKTAGFRGLTGATRASQREFVKRPPPPPRDTTTAPPPRPPRDG